MLKHRLTFLVTLVLACAGGLRQDKIDTKPKLEFEVASIKPSKPGANDDAGIRAMPGGQTYQAENVPVSLMVTLMWKLNDSQVIGGPDWLRKDLWDVHAKAESPQNLDDLHAMFQNMIADRFKLQFHWDTRTLPMYALVEDKSGNKLTVNPSPEPFDFPFKGVAFGKFQAVHCNLLYFGWFISQFPWINRPVEDETGLDKSKFYDFTLAFEPELPDGIDRSKLPPAPGPDFFTAIREQLGLRLESRKGPVHVMVIDSAEKPADN